MNSPAKILKLWNKVNDRFGPSEEGDKGEKKKPSSKDQAAEKQNEKITKGLTVLKTVTQAGVKTPSQIKTFEKTRDKVALVMKKYCKAIKSTKLEGAQDMNKFRKSVKQLTIVVENLSFAKLDNTDEGDVDINALGAVDVAAFDKAMDDPNFAAGDDNISFDDDKPETDTTAPPTSGTVPTAPPLPPKTEQPKVTVPTGGVMTRLNALTSRYTQAIQTTSADVPRMKMLFTTISGLVKDKDLTQAGLVLDELEPLVDKALAGKSGTAPDGKAASDFQTRLKTLMGEAVKVGKTNPTAAQELKLLFSQAQLADRKKDATEAGALLDKAEAVLKQAEAAKQETNEAQGEDAEVAEAKQAWSEGDEDADPDEAPKDLAAAQKAWEVISSNTLNKLRALAKKVAGSGHPDATKAMIELNAVIKNVTKNPDTKNLINNLEKWLKDDDVVADVCDLSFDLRKPLLKGLASLKPFVTA